MELKFIVNGEPRNVNVDDDMRLIDVLRDKLGLTGTKEGCSEGECGACTIIMNGQAVNSCLVLAAQVQDKEIITIEGLEKNGELDKLQSSFINNGAVQCGFCTPGMIMSAKALFMKNSHPSEEEIKAAISGNLCRCTGYAKIVKAIQDAC